MSHFLSVAASLVGWLGSISIIEPAQVAEKADAPKLELRIVATKKHDGDAMAKASLADELKNPPKGYRWAVIDGLVRGDGLEIGTRSLKDPKATWKADQFAGWTVMCEGENRGGSKKSFEFTVVKNSPTTLELSEDASLFLKEVKSYEIMRQKTFPSDAFVREEQNPAGGRILYLLLKLDTKNFTKNDLAKVFLADDSRLKPAIGFATSPAGAKKMGALTREHLPEGQGAYHYFMAILLDGRVVATPMIHIEVSDQGLIEGLSLDQVRSTIESLKKAIESKP